MLSAETYKKKPQMFLFYKHKQKLKMANSVSSQCILELFKYVRIVLRLLSFKMQSQNMESKLKLNAKFRNFYLSRYDKVERKSIKA